MTAILIVAAILGWLSIVFLAWSLCKAAARFDE